MIGRLLSICTGTCLLIAVGLLLAAPRHAAAISATIVDPTAARWPAPAGAGPVVRVRAGEHQGFDRIVFDWTAPVPYRLEIRAGRATVIFERPARLDLSGYVKCPPPRLQSFLPRRLDNGLAVDLGLPPNAHVDHFLNGTKVVIDVLTPGTWRNASAN